MMRKGLGWGCLLLGLTMLAGGWQALKMPAQEPGALGMIDDRSEAAAIFKSDARKLLLGYSPLGATDKKSLLPCAARRPKTGAKC
jgi:hypothetical protein